MVRTFFKRKLRESDFGAIIDQKTGERHKMTPNEERFAMFLLGGRKGNTLRNHIRALVYGTTAKGVLAQLGHPFPTSIQGLDPRP